MGILSSLSEFVGGNLFKEIKDTVVTYFPPDMSPLQKAELEIKVQESLHKQQMELAKMLDEAGRQLDQRIAEQEGTAKDLLSMPILGRLVLFLRGLQRPVWGFAVLYLDFVWFSTGSNYNDQQGTAMICINMLVLGFLFGERTIKNLEPLIIKVFGKG